MVKKYDVVVIGAGPAGMTAAMYASRANLKVALLDRGVYGGQMNNTDKIENYPGFKSIKGPDLAKQMYDSCTQFGAQFVYGDVQKVTVDDQQVKHVMTDSGELVAPVVIIATGSNSRKLGVPGEEKYSGAGVSYCAVCDGAFFKNGNVSVIGGGDSAVEEGLYLANLASQVNLVHRRDALRAEKLLQNRAFKNKKMHFIWNSVVTEVLGNGQKVTGLKIHNRKTNKDTTVPTEGVFVYIGSLPATAPFKDLGITDEKGWIKTDNEMRTRIPGIYAVGDVRGKNLRQVSTSVGDGGIAGQNAFKYVDSLKSKAKA